MLRTSIPSFIKTVWASLAGGAYVREVADTSQIGVNDGWASYPDGFVPLNFQPKSAGGVPPFGQDMNGVLKRTTAWLQWMQAGGPIAYDATFAAAIGGYPEGALIASSVDGAYWLNRVNGNNTNPEGGSSANWTLVPLGGLTQVISGAGLTPSISDATQLARAVRSQRSNWLTAGGTVNAITVTPSPAFATRADQIGVPLRFLSTGANTGPITLNTGTGVLAVTWPDGTAFASGDIPGADYLIHVIDDGTAFRGLVELSPTQIRAIARVDSAASTIKAPKLVTLEANQGSGIPIPSSLDTIMTFSSTVTSGLGTSTWDGSRLTIGAGEGGYWDIYGAWNYVASTNGVFAAARIKINTSTFAAEYDQPTSTSGTGYIIGCRATLKLVPGDYVEFYAYHQAGSTITASADTAYNRTRFMAQLVSAY